MEYKYHPVLKHLAFFVIFYAFMYHQHIFNNEHLIINSLIITFVVGLLDHMFIHNHISPLQSLGEQYIDDDITTTDTDIKLDNLDNDDILDEDESIKSKSSINTNRSNQQNINNNIIHQTDLQFPGTTFEHNNPYVIKYTTNKQTDNIDNIDNSYRINNKIKEQNKNVIKNHNHNCKKHKKSNIKYDNLVQNDARIMADLDNFYDENNSYTDFLAYNS